MTAEGRCPKCGHARPESATACARCGLVFALWSAEKAGAGVELDDVAERLWRAAVERWDDPARHDAFLKHCSQKGLLGPAGRRYRARLDADPQDASAARMQDRIVAMATAAFVVREAAPRPVTRSSWFWIVLVVGAIAGVLGGLLFGRISR